VVHLDPLPVAVAVGHIFDVLMAGQTYGRSDLWPVRIVGAACAISKEELLPVRSVAALLKTQSDTKGVFGGGFLLLPDRNRAIRKEYVAELLRGA
jgi:hypothetical protein